MTNKEKLFFEENAYYDIAGHENWYKWREKKYKRKLSDVFVKKNRKGFEQIHLILKENIKDFKAIFGKQDFCTSDSSNRRLYVWKQEIENGCIWLITGGNGRGTSYEVSEHVQWENIENYLEELIQKLEKIN